MTLISPSNHSSQDAVSVTERQRLSRTSTAKVRTGCVTCKKRHVKCDETKPYCMNCLKSRGYCEGYVIKPRKKRSRPETAAPMPESAVSKPVDQVMQLSPRRLLEPNVNTMDFETDLNALYFDEFLSLMRVSIGGGTAAGAKLWRITMPQLARTNDTLRHAGIAIGALAMSHQIEPMSPTQALTTLSPHYQHAVASYCRALRLQGQASPGTILQDTLFLSVLFICFEIIRGDRQSALQHINHGLAVLFATVSGDYGDMSHLAPNPKAFLADLVDTFANLAHQARSVLDRRIGSGPSLPALNKGLEENGQTFEAFTLLLLHLPKSTAEIETCPAEFRNVAEAEEYWVATQRHGALKAPETMQIVYDSGLLQSEDDDEVDRIIVDLLAHPHLDRVCAEVFRITTIWDDAFQPLYRRLMLAGTADRDSYLRALHLRLMFLIVHFMSKLPLLGDHRTAEALTPVCREMNSLLETSLRTLHLGFTTPAHRVSLDGGITWQLSIVALYCRDPLVREDAIRIMERYPRREGLWDTRIFVAVAQRNRMIEKMNAEHGTPQQQWLRLWRREFLLEDAGNRILMRHMAWDEARGGWELIEEAGEIDPATAEAVWTRQPMTGKKRFMLSNLIPIPGRN
ncbi:hypothetical protein BN1723_009695 [Verticillium longisporum]|uniref:Zn(2)-C6 fungal-type domain-containing protein n=1 Tax=Verticillium longisporum TaxID=100787 RepID=A0A0G4KRP2_VERLO|nr:hypothetical protein BN1723_009695 [Verticillium longisporum]